MPMSSLLFSFIYFTFASGKRFCRYYLSFYCHLHPQIDCGHHHWLLMILNARTFNLKTKWCNVSGHTSIFFSATDRLRDNAASTENYHKSVSSDFSLALSHQVCRTTGSSLEKCVCKISSEIHRFSICY